MCSVVCVIMCHVVWVYIREVRVRYVYHIITSSAFTDTM